jgi:addiction module HigA family antidote
MIRIPMHRPSTHPGEMLQAEFLPPLGLTQRELADAIRVLYRKINELINGQHNLMPVIALRSAKFFGMSADFWMSLQLRRNLYHAHPNEADI